MAFDPTSVFTALANLFSLGQALSPAIVEWIEAKIPAEKQAVMTRRIRRCKRLCRSNKLLNPVLIKQMVDVLFQDIDNTQRQEISNLLTFELQPRDLQNLH